MGIFANLFGKPVLSAREVKIEMLKKERERRRKIIELRRVEQKKEKLIDDIKKARRDGQNFQVDILWEDLKSFKIDGAFAKRELSVLNLEYITLKRYVRGMERLEKQKNTEGIQKLLGRIRESGLEARLATQEVDEKAYLDELNAIMDDIGMQVEEMDSFTEEDPEKMKFLDAIDAINTAEESGDIERAMEKENRLKDTLKEQDPLAENY
jgi:hypothetical protein